MFQSRCHDRGAGRVLILTALLIVASFAWPAEGDVPMPERLDSREFRDVIVRIDDDLYISGQPSPEGFSILQNAGVTTVVNLRTAGEMDDRSVVPFDEASLLESLGMRYVHVPAGGPDTPYTPAMVDAFAETLSEASGKVLLHCTVAWRASHLYAAYLHRYRGLSLDEAVRHASAINLGTLPLSGFLGEPLTVVINDE